jgi:hypothetical protein
MELSFSQRMGFKPVQTTFQTDFISRELRNSLWNEVKIHYFSRLNVMLLSQSKISSYLLDFPMEQELIYKLWQYYFKRPLDEIDKYWSDDLKFIKEYFLTCIWYEVYEFIEFVANNYEDDSVNEAFSAACNVILKRELSAYSFVGKMIIPITSDQEIAEIEEALSASRKFTQHLDRALELLADKNAPDYRNSMKESISAVEAICKLIIGSPKATLDDALRQLEAKLGSVHPALKEGFRKIYAYSGDAHGIRHAWLGESNLDVEDARFMLIACSAFINYLVAKADKAGIQITQK